MKRSSKEEIKLAAYAALAMLAISLVWFAANRGPQRPLLEPVLESEICPRMPQDAPARPASWAIQQPSAVRAPGAPVDMSQRKPVRMIRDPYAAYSSVAVDPVRDEVVLTDENLFSILVYNRLANTPPSAKMTEPKRVISGLKTNIEFQCALYIDPTNGDIYAVNNDTVDKLVIFDRNAKGDVPPTRELHTPHGTFGIAVDERDKTMYLTVQHSNAVSVYQKTARGEDAPIRLLQGSRTLLADPHGIAVDTKNDLLYVSNFGAYREFRSGGEPAVSFTGDVNKPNWPSGEEVAGSGRYLPPSITVYPLQASGDVPPLRVIQGPKTQLSWPAGLAIDPDRGELYVANDMGHAVLVFSVSASGDATPVRTLRGPNTGIRNPTSITLDLKNNELWVANFGNHSATVYKRDAAGDTAPLRTIRSAPLGEPVPGFGNPFSVAYDSKRREILVPN